MAGVLPTPGVWQAGCALLGGRRGRQRRHGDTWGAQVPFPWRFSLLFPVLGPARRHLSLKGRSSGRHRGDCWAREATGASGTEFLDTCLPPVADVSPGVGRHSSCCSNRGFSRLVVCVSPLSPRLGASRHFKVKGFLLMKGRPQVTAGWTRNTGPVGGRPEAFVLDQNLDSLAGEGLRCGRRIRAGSRPVSRLWRPLLRSRRRVRAGEAVAGPAIGKRPRNPWPWHRRCGRAVGRRRPMRGRAHRASRRTARRRRPA